MGKSINQYWTKIIQIFVLMGLSALIGCGGSYANLRPVIDQKTPLPPQSGTVVARVINASSFPLPFNKLVLASKNINESDKNKLDELSAREPFKRDTTIFASSMPAGSYSLQNVHAWHFRGEYRYSNFIRVDAKFGTFEVKPGQVTDLGTLVYYTKPQNDRYLKMLIRVPETANGEVLKQFFPFYQFNESQLLTWTEDERDSEREDLFASVAQNPLDFQPAYLAPDGSTYLLGKLGVLVKRTAGGDWELDAVDTNLNLNSIAQNERGDLVVGGAEGRLFYKIAGGDWQDISIGSNTQIKAIQFAGEDAFDIVVDESARAAIYRVSMNGDQAIRNELNSFSYHKGWTHFADEDSRIKINSDQAKRRKRISHLSINHEKDDYFINVSTQRMGDDGAFRDTDVDRYQYDNKTWQIIGKKDSEMNVIIKSGILDLGIEEAGFWDWDGRPEYHRFDSEKQEWVEIKRTAYKCSNGQIEPAEGCSKGKMRGQKPRETFSFLTLPVFRSDMEAIVIGRFLNYKYGDEKDAKKPKLLITKNGGRSWLDTGAELPFPYCTSIVRHVTDKIVLYCDGASSDFYESSDNGKTWDHVRQQENF